LANEPRAILASGVQPGHRIDDRVAARFGSDPLRYRASAFHPLAREFYFLRIRCAATSCGLLFFILSIFFHRFVGLDFIFRPVGMYDVVAKFFCDWTLKTCASFMCVIEKLLDPDVPIEDRYFQDWRYRSFSTSVFFDLSYPAKYDPYEENRCRMSYYRWVRFASAAAFHYASTDVHRLTPDSKMAAKWSGLLRFLFAVGFYRDANVARYLCTRHDHHSVYGTEPPREDRTSAFFANMRASEKAKILFSNVRLGENCDDAADDFSKIFLHVWLCGCLPEDETTDPG